MWTIVCTRRVGTGKVGDKLVTTMFESLTPGFATAFADRKADRPFVG